MNEAWVWKYINVELVMEFLSHHILYSHRRFSSYYNHRHKWRVTGSSASPVRWKASKKSASTNPPSDKSSTLFQSFRNKHPMTIVNGIDLLFCSPVASATGRTAGNEMSLWLLYFYCWPSGRLANSSFSVGWPIRFTAPESSQQTLYYLMYKQITRSVLVREGPSK